MASRIPLRNEDITILVADDDDAIRFLACDTLADAGFQVIEARNGSEALALFHQHQPNMVLLDLIMPEIDGFKVCRRIRSLSGGHELVPIMIMTGLNDEDSINQAFEMGATDFVTKPLNHLILAQRTRYMLRTHRILQTVEQRELRLETAERIAKLGSWEWDTRDQQLNVSREYNRILGYPEDYATTVSDVARLFPDTERKRMRANFEAAVERRIPNMVNEHTLVTLAGTRKRLRQETEFVYRPDNSYMVSGTLQDITEETAVKEQILKLAYYDSLTLLPNRTFFRAHLEYALKEARMRGNALAVILLDLDLFTRVNNSMGTDAGDNILMQVSHRLHDALASPKATDLIHAAIDPHAAPESAHDVLARLEGDQFVIMRYHFGKLDELVVLLQKIMKRMAAPFHYKGMDVVVTASVGVAFYPVNGNNTEALMRNADAAMRYAKLQGRNQFLFYTGEVDTRSKERMALENDLRLAINHGQFELHYQPKVHLRQREVRSVEALIRWRHPEQGLISPSLFIPMAEELGLINELGTWLLNEACRQTKAWNAEGIPPLRTAINISAVQLRSANFVEKVRVALEKHRLLPGQLEIEITEGVLMEDTTSMIKTIEGLRSLGVKVALDDFGTGFSSLSYLTRFPFTTLKIDRCFIKDCVRHGQAAAIVHTIIQLCKNLNLEVVAEGVEIEEELKFLYEHRCDMIQGFLFSTALDATALLNYVRRKPWMDQLDFLN